MKQRSLRRQKPGQIGVAVLVMGAGCALSIGAYWLIDAYQSRWFAARTEQEIALLEEHARRVIGSLETVGRELAGLRPAGSREIPAEAFRQVARRELVTGPYLHSMEWLTPVEGAEQEDFEDRLGVKIGLLADDKRILAPPRSFYLPVLHVEPFEEHKSQIGLDRYIKAARLAIDEGRPHASVPDRILYPADKPVYGTVLCQPVYTIPADQLATPDQRRAELLGVLTVTYRVEDFVRQHFGDLDERILIRIHDVTQPDRKVVVIDESADSAVARANQNSANVDAAFLERIRDDLYGCRLEFVGREYWVSCLPSPVLLREFSLRPWVALITGIAGSLFAALVTLRHGTRQAALYSRQLEREIALRERAKEHLAERDSRLTLLNGLAEAIVSGKQSEEVVAIAVDRLADQLPTLTARYSTWSTDGSTVTRYWRGPDDSSHDDFRTERIEVPDASRQQTVAVNDVMVDERTTGIADELTRGGIRSVLWQPVEGHDGEPGLLSLESATIFRWTAGHVETMRRVAECLALAKQKTHADGERDRTELSLRQDRGLLRRLLELRERDRKLIAYEIHDGFLQEIIGAKMVLEAVHDRLRGEEHSESTDCATAIRYLASGIDEGRQLIGRLTPLVLEQHGLVAAVESLIEQEQTENHLEVRFSHDLANRPSAVLEGVLYRMVQEALTNVRRHSQVQSAAVDLRADAHRIQLEVQDDGVGFDVGDVPAEHFGIRGIQERARVFGGTAEIDSRPGLGTRIRVQLPMVADFDQGIGQLHSEAAIDR